MLERANSLLKEIEDEVTQIHKTPLQPYTPFSVTSKNSTEKTEHAQMTLNYHENCDESDK
jgi:hypothetical protein